MFTAPLPSLFVKGGSKWSYTKVTYFNASTNSVYALAISHDGQSLASGGTDGIKVWSISSGKEIGSSNANQDTCGAVSCAAWMKTKHSIAETLCYGTGLGYLVFLRPNPVDRKYQEICARRLGAGFEITCIAWDASWVEGGLRIAVGMRDNVVQVLLLNTNSQLQPIFAGRLSDTVPRSIAFSDHENMYVFGLFNGKVIRMNTSKGTILSEHHYRSVIGYAAVSQKKHLVVIDNAANGFTLYRLDCPDPMQTYVTELPTVFVPKQVAFGEDAKIVVGGSDKGIVYVFDRKSGKLLETLRHANSGLVQSIAVRDVGGHCMIASASATGRKRVTINIWQHRYNSSNMKDLPRWTFKSSLWTLVQHLVSALFVVCLLGISLFVVQLDVPEKWVAHVPQITRWCARLQAKSTPGVSLQHQEPEKTAQANDESSAVALEDLVRQFMALTRQADLQVIEPVREKLHEREEKSVSASKEIIYL